MKVAVCGTGEYLASGLAHLVASGRKPDVVSDPDQAAPGTDVLVCLAFPKILKRDTIDRFPKGCLNFHCGLPNYRGRHPLQWMLIDGVEEIPCDVHYMDEGIDTGDIVAHGVVEVGRNETYATALHKVVKKVGPLVESALDSIERGAVEAQKQNGGKYIRKRTPEDSRFSFDMPSAAVHRFINAMSYPMPTAECAGKQYLHSYIGEYPGQIIAETKDDRLVIATQDGVVLVERR